MEVGLDLVAVYENGIIYDKKVLDVDEEQLIADITSAHSAAFNLAVEVGYLCDDTVDTILSKASREAYNLAMEAKIMNKDTADRITSYNVCYTKLLRLGVSPSINTFSGLRSRWTISKA